MASNSYGFVRQNTLTPLFCLFWASMFSYQAAAQFAYNVYDGNFNQLPDFSTLSPTAGGQSSSIGLSVTNQVDTFGLVFTNQITVADAGNYVFSTTSDDGSKLYIDSATVVDNDGVHPPVTVSGTIFLNPGSYALRVEFFEKAGGQILDVRYRTNNANPQPIPANGQLEYVRPQNRSDVGEWGGVIQWPEIAISAANLPDGRVLTWSSTETDRFPSNREFTHASIFDPLTSTFQTADSNFHDMFCAGITMLEDGNIIASGGNPSDRRTSLFDVTSLTWAPLSEMNDARWYGTNVTLPNNQIFSSFGKDAGNRSEVYDPALDAWIPRSNVSMQTLVSEQNAINAAPNPSGAFTQEWWAHLAVTPQGDVFQGGPTPTWHRFDPINNTPNEVLGQPIGDTARMYGNAVTYDAGKVLLVGGGDRRLANPTVVNNVYLVDLNGPAPVITAGAPMNFARALSNTVTLPNGEILVVGGNSSAKIFNDDASVLAAEIYTPATDSWRIVDSIDIPRNYHSIAILLKDGRVLSAGGGACGNCSANHLDGQIFSPPYLFNGDGTTAARPTITSVTAQASAGDQLTVNASSDTASFSMVRLSGTTHHLNTDQRFLPVDSIDNGNGSFTVTLPANPNVLIVGHYWLYALKSNGTPSIGETVQIVRPGGAGGPTDTDGDGVPDDSDAFPNNPNETTDSDNDGVGDNADAFPNDPSETVDSDGDGVGDNADAFPDDPTRTEAASITPLPEWPRHSSTLIVEQKTGSERIWNVNPDNNSVSVSGFAGSLLAEIPVGEKPWSLAVSPSTNQVYVTNKGSSTVSIINTDTLAVTETIALQPYAQPHGITFSGDGASYYIVLEATAELEKRNRSSNQLIGRLPLSGTLRHVSMSFDDSQILVSNFITPPIPGEATVAINVNAGAAEIFAVASDSFTLSNTVQLSHDNRGLSESQGPGMPNYLGAAVVSFDNQYAYIPSKKDNIDSGLLRQKPGMTFEFTVRANTSRIVLNTNAEDSTFRVDHDNAGVATSAALTGDNRYLLVTLETSRELAVYDTQLGFQLMRLPTGRAPQSVALSADGRRAYVHNFMDRSVSRFDLTEMLETNLPATNELSAISVVGTENLSAQVLLGKQHFYDAADARLARDAYMSCASCHKEAKHDGRVWDFTQMGEGLRNTISLRGKGGMAHGTLHWSANFDELQDFEGQIRSFAAGTGLMSNAAFSSGTRSQPLGDTKAGISADLDALAAYLASLNEADIGPQHSPQGLSAEAAQGQQIFADKGCASCHSGEFYTDSSTGTRHDIGSLTSASGQRLSGALDGLDTPTLLGLSNTGPYLHDGSAATITAAVLAHTDIAITTNEAERVANFINELPAVTPLTGFSYQIYDGKFDRLPDFSTLTPIASGLSDTIDISVTTQTKTYALVFTRQITITSAGDYRFNLTSDEGSKLYINGAVVVDNDGLHTRRTESNTISLTPGQYDLRVEFFEKYWGQMLAVSYQFNNGSARAIPAGGNL